MVVVFLSEPLGEDHLGLRLCPGSLDPVTTEEVALRGVHVLPLSGRWYLEHTERPETY